MAFAVGKTSPLMQNELTAVEELTALTADGITIPYNVADDGKILLIVENSGGAATATVKQGNGLQGVAAYTISIAAGATYYGVFESGAFMNVIGENAGLMIVSGTTSMKAGALALPY
jgi:hypothetical protein